MALLANNQFTGLDRRLYSDTAVTNTAVMNATGASACTLYSFSVKNDTGGASGNYLKFYDTTATVTVGTTIPDFVIPIRAAVKEVVVIPGGMSFVNGISYAATQTAGTAGTTAPAQTMTLILVTS